jgi:hypothetical protein
MWRKSNLMLAFGVCLGQVFLIAQPERGAGGGQFVVYTWPTIGEISSHPFFGGGSFVDLGNAASLGIESAYISMGNQTLRTFPGLSDFRNSRLLDLNATLPIRVPFTIKKITPYGLLSMGVQHASFEHLASGPDQTIYVRTHGQFRIRHRRGCPLLHW